MSSVAYLMLRSAPLRDAACGGSSGQGARLEARTHIDATFSSLATHVLDDFDQLADGGDRFVEGGLLFAVERDLDDALDTAGADHDRDADIEVLDPVLAVEPGGAGQDALLVAQ